MGEWCNREWRWGDLWIQLRFLLHATTTAAAVFQLSNRMQAFMLSAGTTYSVVRLLKPDFDFSMGSCHEVVKSYRLPFGPFDRFDSAFVNNGRQMFSLKSKLSDEGALLIDYRCLIF